MILCRSGTSTGVMSLNNQDLLETFKKQKLLIIQIELGHLVRKIVLQEGRVSDAAVLVKGYSGVYGSSHNFHFL